jgi:hypothetical protein
MIQVMTRSITNNISMEDAAKVLLRRQGRGGTGSRWLPDYLDGLPGSRSTRRNALTSRIQPDPAGCGKP